MTQAAFQYFQTKTADELLAAIYAPEMTHEHLAGFGREVVETAQQGDRIAREILAAAGHDLGVMATSVIRRLGMRHDVFPIAYVGSIFAAGELLMEPLRAEVLRLAPHATLAPPLYSPAEAAALMARKERPRLALAG